MSSHPTRLFQQILFSLVVSALALAFATPAHCEKGGPHVAISRHAPDNLFNAGESVVFEVPLKDFPVGKVDATARVTDYLGQSVWEKSYSVDIAGGQKSSIAIDAGKLGRGYYELTVSAKEGANAPVEGKASFGVMEFESRTAQEVRDGGYIFGLKWWGGLKNQPEMLDAMDKLGLQWTRMAFVDKAQVTTTQMLTNYPMNAVIKVERFPKELFDEAKYGPLADWEKKYGRGAWTLKTLPQKEPYQKLLKEQLATVPKEQNIFEIWNEPWDKMPPEDFATLCQWIVEVIAADRPNAIIGPNLYGSTSPYEYDARVIKAGGMKGMKMVALHPYAVSEDRAWLRQYEAWLKDQLGRNMDIYITEYGSHSTPEGPAKRSELEQARRVVRQSLALYAEGVKALIPHWAGQTESNRTYVEDWFGFVRKNEEPKPVLLAHANCARLIDGSHYLGDLWYGPQVAAMVFEKKGVNTLVLWTLSDAVAGQEDTSSKEIEVEPGVPQVVATDIMGGEKVLKPEGGKLKLKLDEAPVYLVGISPDLAKQATKELRPDRFPPPAKPKRNVRIAKKLPAEPAMDGKFDDWKGATQIALLNPKVAGGDCSGTGYVSWDDHNLYIAVDVRDNEMLNTESRSKLYLQDSVELFLSLQPREEGTGYSPDDLQFFLTPTSGEGKPIVGLVADREAGTVEDVKDAKFFGGPTHNADAGWAVQVAIPWSALHGLKPAKGTHLAMEMRINDADTSHPRFKVDPVDAGVNFSVTDPTTWSLLDLEE